MVNLLINFKFVVNAEYLRVFDWVALSVKVHLIPALKISKWSVAASVVLTASAFDDFFYKSDLDKRDNSRLRQFYGLGPVSM